ncbi:MAG: hypothetical protein ACOYNU_04285 [Bacteroidales bacterium]
MRWFFKFSLLMLMYLVLTAKSCDDGDQFNSAHEEKQVALAKDSITAAFATDSLTSPALRAFEATACQKIYDLGDYLVILSDTGTGRVFKTSVSGAIHDLFISGDVNIRLSVQGCPGGKDENNELVRHLREAGLKQFEVSQGMKFDSVKVEKMAVRVSDTLYQGILRFRVSCNQPGNGNISARPGRYKTGKFVVVKREKRFGKISLDVWSVLIGNIGDL